MVYRHIVEQVVLHLLVGRGIGIALHRVELFLHARSSVHALVHIHALLVCLVVQRCLYLGRTALCLDILIYAAQEVEGLLVQIGRVVSLHHLHASLRSLLHIPLAHQSTICSHIT